MRGSIALDGAACCTARDGNDEPQAIFLKADPRADRESERDGKTAFGGFSIRRARSRLSPIDWHAKSPAGPRSGKVGKRWTSTAFLPNCLILEGMASTGNGV